MKHSQDIGKRERLERAAKRGESKAKKRRRERALRELTRISEEFRGGYR